MRLIPSHRSSSLSYSYSLLSFLPLVARREISSFPWCRLYHEYAGAVVYNVNTTPAVIDSVREMSPLGFSDVYAGEW